MTRHQLGYGLLVVALAAGCGAPPPTGKEVKGAKVAGVVLENGKPIKVLPNETIHVSFAMGDGPDQIAAAGQVNVADGTFAIDGPTKQGLPPGKYRVTVAGNCYDLEQSNRFEPLFNSTRRKLYADVGPEEGQRFEIDVGKGWTATKK
ncbi:MAG: hypothetical protein U0746_06960 [Gemmataceae bacterium]